MNPVTAPEHRVDLQAYLHRIGHTGPCRPDLPTLQALHRQHLLNIPYESLDIHMGRPLSLDVGAIYDKIVGTGRRGGWCYEMNSLFLWAVREIGFDATLVGAREWAPGSELGPEGGHVAIVVRIEGQAFLADLGWGNGLLDVMPLEAGAREQHGCAYELALYAGPNLPAEPTWTFANWTGDGYAFTLRPRRIEEFTANSEAFQHVPDSRFVKTPVCHRFTPEGVLSLRGTVMKLYGPAGEQQVWRLESQADYIGALAQRFGIEAEAPDLLWRNVWARHLAWLEAGATA